MITGFTLIDELDTLPDGGYEWETLRDPMSAKGYRP